MSYHYDGGHFRYSSEIENPAYTAGKNYEEAPERTCGDCKYLRVPECESIGICIRDIESDLEQYDEPYWCSPDGEPCEHFRWVEG